VLCQDKFTYNNSDELHDAVEKTETGFNTLEEWRLIFPRNK